MASDEQVRDLLLSQLTPAERNSAVAYRFSQPTAAELASHSRISILKRPGTHSWSS